MCVCVYVRVRMCVCVYMCVYLGLAVPINVARRVQGQHWWGYRAGEGVSYEQAKRLTGDGGAGGKWAYPMAR